MKTRFILIAAGLLAAIIFAMQGCGSSSNIGSGSSSNIGSDSNDSNESGPIGGEDDTNYGVPYKQSRPYVPDTLNLSFIVMGDQQPDVTHDWDHDSDKIKRIRHVVDSINSTYCFKEDDSCIGIVAVGDMTQHTNTQELIAFRQMLEGSYPGLNGGSISGVSNDDYTRYSDGSKIEKPLFPGLGNHDDPTGGNGAEYPTLVRDYIRDRIKGSASLYETPTLSNADRENYSEYSSGDLYAWEWGSYHFIHTNIWAGYNGYTADRDGSTNTTKLAWLAKHLKENIGDSGKPVFLFQHYGWSGWNFTTPWWTQDNADDLINVLCRREDTSDTCNAYNIVGIFSGHDHETGIRTIKPGNDKDGNPVEFSNYIVNDSGPGDNLMTGFFIVQLSDKEDGKGHMDIHENVVEADWNGDGEYQLLNSAVLYKDKDFNLSFVDWEQGEPNNYNGIESCVAVGSKGRFNDRDCSETRHYACRRSDGELFFSDDEHSWLYAQQMCSQSGLVFASLTNVVEQREFINLYKDKGMTASVWINSKSPWVLERSINKHIGEHSQGAGMALGDIDRNGVPDVVAFSIDNPDGENYGHYNIGWNINKEGKVTGWSDTHSIAGGTIGDHTQGGGVTVGDINGNNIPDILYFYIDNPDGQNYGYYLIQFDVGKDGTGQSEGIRVQIPSGLLGYNSQGGGVALGDIDKNGKLDLVVYNIDDTSGQNIIRYKIGWNIDESGRINDWSTTWSLDKHIGEQSQGGGIALSDIDEDGVLDLIMYYIDNPDGVNNPYYFIGWGKTNGEVKEWSENRKMGPFTLGEHNEGGGIAVGDITGNGRPDFIAGAIDNPEGLNDFQYGVGLDIDKEGKFVTLHLDSDGNLTSESN